MLEEFRELVRAGILRVTPENEVLPVKDRPEKGSEKQPSSPASREEEVALLDKQLIEWLERRREKKIEESRRRGPQAPAEAIASHVRDRVIERVAQKVMETWDQSSLRDQIVDRIAEEIFRRMQRNLE